jgi:hypothetical protein
VTLKSGVRRWAYRSRQFFIALLAGVSAAEMAEARQVLGSDLYLLFAALPQQYRRHALNVCRRVVEAGCHDRDVLQAALLHDAGKFDPISLRYVTIFHRVAVVLLEVAPGGRPVLRQLSRPGSLRDFALYPFYLSRHHPYLGARLAAEHGASDAVVALIAGHHRHSGQNAQLLALQAADDNS